MKHKDVINATFTHQLSTLPESHVFATIMLVLILLNIFFHSIGCCLLIALYKNGRESVQQIYLINLSVTHTLGNVFQLISRILLMIHSIQMCNFMIAILLTMFSFSYYMNMNYIVVDKALDIPCLLE